MMVIISIMFCYVMFFCVFLFIRFVCLLLLNYVSSPMLGIIIIFVNLQCAVSVIGLVAVDSAHKQ
jgi:hypothetical protein